MNTEPPSFVFEIPPATGESAARAVPDLGCPAPQPLPWWSEGDADEAARRGGAKGRGASTAQRMATLRAWEFVNIPMLRRRAPAEVFFAVWALSGPDHEAAFPAKAVLAQARISERAARLALRMLLEDGWIQRYGNGHVDGDIDGRLRPYVGTAKLKAILVEYEARIAETF